MMLHYHLVCWVECCYKKRKGIKSQALVNKILNCLKMKGDGWRDNSQSMDHFHKDLKFGKHQKCFYCVQPRYFTKDSYKKKREQSLRRTKEIIEEGFRQGRYQE
jgi:hypothetical protein